MQIHHITSTQIAEWAKTKEAQAALPRLVRRLIHATANSDNCDFPAGDSTSSPGWDGELSCSQETPWTPTGQSYWELSCEDKPTGKANRDYTKRTQQTDAESRIQSTLVIVTARKWSQKKQWLKKKGEEGEWKAVRAFDADNLEQWLEQCPAIALQFAEELRISGPEVESVGKYWETWSCQASPAITAESFHTSRERSRDRLIANLRKNLEPGQPGICRVKADSAEEAVAFVCSALLAQPDLASNSLVVTDPVGWRYVDMHPSLKVAVAVRPEIAERPSRRAGLAVVIPYAAGDMGGYFRGSANGEDDADLAVERPDIYEFEKALSAMGLSESEAHRVAASAGRSWSVYRRRFAVNPAIRKPAWLAAPQASALSTLCLLGAWSGDSAADKDLVSFLAGRAYEEVEKELRHLSRLDDPPVLVIGDVWKAKSALELLDLFGDRITGDELDRFFEIARRILAAPDPELELLDEKRYAAQIYGKVRPQSGLLIRALCDALVKLAVAGIQAPALADAHIESRVARLVCELLDEADGTRWLSLSSLLPYLAEAAPATFLKAIEKSLNQPDAPASRLITETGSSSTTGRCWHAGLLWALETLAWSPNQFSRVALILARLVHVPYRNNWGNTPMASLVNLFRSWHPQTSANIQQRIAALDTLIAREQDVAFDLLDRLLNVGPDMAMQAHRPKWRSDDVGFGRGVTGDEHMEMLVAAADRLITLAEQQAQRIARLIEKLFIFDTEYIEKTLSLIEPFSEASALDEDRETIRAALRKKIHQHRNYSDKQDESLKVDVDTMEQLYHRLEPKDLLVRHRWLFANGWIHDVPWREPTDYGKQDERAENLRLSGFQEIYTMLGMAGVERLALSCKSPYWVGVYLAKVRADKNTLITWMKNKGGEFTTGEPLVEAMRGLLHALEVSQALELTTAAVDVGKLDGWGVEKIARCMMLAPQGRTTWDRVAAYGSKVESAFWCAVQPDFWWANDMDDLHFVINHLLKVDRPRTALEICKFNSGNVDTTMIADILEHILSGKEPDGPLLDGYRIGKALEQLRASQIIGKERLIRLEFGFIPALRYGAEHQAETLYESIMSEPPRESRRLV